MLCALFSNRSELHTPTASPLNFALLHCMLTTIFRRRSWIGLLVLCEVSSVSVSRLLFFVDRYCLGNPMSYFCRCDRHASSVVSDSSLSSKLFVTTVFVMTADTTTLSLSTPSLIVQQLTSVRSDSSSTRFPAVGRSTLRVLPPPRLIHSFSSTLILFMFLHLSSCSRRRIFTRF